MKTISNRVYWTKQKINIWVEWQKKEKSVRNKNTILKKWIPDEKKTRDLKTVIKVTDQGNAYKMMPRRWKKTYQEMGKLTQNNKTNYWHRNSTKICCGVIKFLLMTSEFVLINQCIVLETFYSTNDARWQYNVTEHHLADTTILFFVWI